MFAKSKVRACVDWHVRTLLISLDRRVARINKRMLFFPFSSATRSRLLELLKKMNGSQWKRKSQPLTIKKSLLNCAFTVIYTFEYVSYLRSYSNTTLNATFKFATYAVFFGLTLLRKFKLKRFSTRTYFYSLFFSLFLFSCWEESMQSPYITAQRSTCQWKYIVVLFSTSIWRHTSHPHKFFLETIK